MCLYDLRVLRLLAITAPIVQRPATNPREQVIIIIGILIALALIGGTAILILRRRLFQKETDDGVAGSLFEQLRGMRDRGEISPEEFEQTRQAMIRRVKDSQSGFPSPASKKIAK